MNDICIIWQSLQRLSVLTTWTRSFVKEFLWTQVLHTLNQMDPPPHTHNHLNHLYLSATTRHTTLSRHPRTWWPSPFRPSATKRQRARYYIFNSMFSQISLCTYTRPPWGLGIARVGEHRIGHVDTLGVRRRLWAWSPPSAVTALAHGRSQLRDRHDARMVNGSVFIARNIWKEFFNSIYYYYYYAHYSQYSLKLSLAAIN